MCVCVCVCVVCVCLPKRTLACLLRDGNTGTVMRIHDSRVASVDLTGRSEENHLKSNSLATIASSRAAIWVQRGSWKQCFMVP